MFNYFFDQLKKYLDVAEVLSKAEKQSISNIVGYAISSTETHMGRYGSNQFDRSSQILSTIWLEASNELMKYNNSELKRFANILKEKSSFWSNPMAFDYSNPMAYEMTLEQVKNKLKELTI